MRKKLTIPLLLAAAVALTMAIMAFSPADGYYDYGEWTPYYMQRADLEQSVKLERIPREMSDPGKIYVSGDYIFVNEKYKGVHIINNSDPSSPQKVGYIVVPGCLDMAVKENIIYLDNAVDLVALNLDTGAVTTRIKNYFPEKPSPDGYSGDYYDRPKGLILVGWTKK